tara:strand:+ start:741 stop:1049 length:309 start_codon:yes stop_codon:yes gene_type:complete
MTKILFEGVIRDMTPTEEKEHNDFQAEVASRQFDGELTSLRLKRNKLLLECDWIELNNAPLTDLQKDEWRAYRTELRDLTNGLTNADEVIAKDFPTKPGEEE